MSKKYIFPGTSPVKMSNNNVKEFLREVKESCRNFIKDQERRKAQSYVTCQTKIYR